MYELLKEISETNNWFFTYARPDHQNLFDEDEINDNDLLVFLDPVKIDESFNDFGAVESIKYSGSFMLVVSSDYDEESYEYRYINYIKPILDNTLNVIKSSIRCESDLNINNWSTIEVINYLDFNSDGVIVKYVLSDE